MIKLLFCLLLFQNFVFGQELTTTEFKSRQNMYYDAVGQYLVLTSKNTKPIFDTLFIQQDNVITDSLIGVSHHSQLLIVDSAELSSRLRQAGSFVLYRMMPLSFHEGVFFINIVPFVVTQQNDEIQLSYTGTYRLEYYYNSKRKAFVFDRAKLLSF